ncbi:hypothetical protein AAT19DRAFT_10736 [Rhodotorula toruloides]|uniref:Uncharacterized protein n=1 Tax=Rhodotorula toruloides TaxID=5286 RepID=A0A2S9ZZK5_RHOTO|nr:hypothetical protein AAT19DRAFT_10736 [Rhodotorula toruloides]
MAVTADAAIEIVWSLAHACERAKCVLAAQVSNEELGGGSEAVRGEGKGRPGAARARTPPGRQRNSSRTL